MRCLILAALLATALGSPWSLPRLPLSVLLRNQRPLSTSDRIVGGNVVQPNSLPFQISLQRKSGAAGYSHMCGGSIYNANWVLNAAHCLSGVSASNLQVVAGEHDLNVDSGLEQLRSVARTIVHPNYSSRTYENDIGLIEVDPPFDLSVSSAAVISIPASGSETSAGTNVDTSGWGTTSSGGSLSAQLRSVTLRVVSDADCDAANGAGSVYPSMICAAADGKDSCQGDSGGPLFTRNPLVQVGIVSWGYGCADPRYPGVYTQVSYFHDWITNNAV